MLVLLSCHVLWKITKKYLKYLAIGNCWDLGLARF